MQEMFPKLVTGIVRQKRPASVTWSGRIAGFASLLGHVFETLFMTGRPVYVTHRPVALCVRTIGLTLIHLIFNNMDDRFLIYRENRDRSKIRRPVVTMKIIKNNRGKGTGPIKSR